MLLADVICESSLAQVECLPELDEGGEEDGDGLDDEDDHDADADGDDGEDVEGDGNDDGDGVHRQAVHTTVPVSADQIGVVHSFTLPICL